MKIPRPKLNRYTTLLILGVALNIGLWLLWSRFPDSQGPLTLYFRYGGPGALLGSRGSLALLPGVGLLTLLVNSVLTVSLYRRDVALAQIIAAVAVGVQGILLLALVALFVINQVPA